jgi:hypothetical protein
MPSRNYIICGHGQLMLNKHQYVDEFRSHNSNVITLAPPTATCSYPIESLVELRNGLHLKNDSSKTVQDFYKNIFDTEKQILKTNYCNEDWIGYFSKLRGNYDTKKGCGVQMNNIQDKYFTFTDSDHINNYLGIWDLETNTNIIDDDFPVEPLDEESKIYSFSDVVNFLRYAYDDGVELNFLDCTCSVIYHDSGEHILDNRLQRRIQRSVLHSSTLQPNKKNRYHELLDNKGGYKKKKNKTNKRNKRNKTKRNKRNKK